MGKPVTLNKEEMAETIRLNTLELLDNLKHTTNDTRRFTLVFDALYGSAVGFALEEDHAD